MLKVGLIGRGNISYAHTSSYDKIYEDSKGAQVVAGCDIRPERLEDLGDVRKYTDIDTFLKEEQGKLDYVDICLPTYLHKEVAVKAMQAGFNVLLEKPMALNVQDADEIVKVSEETGKLLMVAQCSRFLGAYRVMLDYIKSGELGKIRCAEFYREGGDLEPMGYQNWFRDEKLSGGAIVDLHVHDVDMIRGAFGMPKAVSVVARNDIPGSGYDALAVNYVYDDFFVSAKCDWTIKNDRFNTRAIRFNYEKGYLYVDRSPDRTTFVKVDSEGNVEDLIEKMDAAMHYNEIVYYIDCLKNHKPVDHCPPHESRDAIAIAMAEKKSADLGGALVTL